MTDLGVIVRNRTAPAARGAPTDTGQAFVVGQAGSGPAAATLCRSIGDFVAAYGVRDSNNGALYDWVDTFFREGGAQVWIGKYTVGNIDTGLGLFDYKKGPGQIAIAGSAETYGATTFGKLLNHAQVNNRFALLDVDIDDTVAEMTTLAGLVPTTNNDYGMLVGPWVDIPAPAGTVGGATRSIPASAVFAALCQRVEALGNPNRAAAGRDFPLQYVLALRRTVTDAELTTLLDAGVNLIVDQYGVLEPYGFQTTRDQSADDPFWQANVSRARMWLTAQARALGEGFAFKPIDARGHLSSALKRVLLGAALDLYNVDGLYGTTFEEAASIEVGASVNTTKTVAQGELHAVGEFIFTPHAKVVYIDLVTVPVTGQVSSAS